MSKVLRAVDHLIARLLLLGGVLATLLLIFAALAIPLGVFFRQVVGIPLSWPSEIVVHLVLVIVMLSAGEAYRRGAHISVDLLIGKASDRVKRGVRVWTALAVLVLAIILVDQGFDMIAFSQMVGMRTHDRLDIPTWWVEAFIPVGGTLLGLAAARDMVRALLGAQPDVEHRESPL